MSRRRGYLLGALLVVLFSALVWLPLAALLVPSPPGCQDGPCAWTTADLWQVLRGQLHVLVPLVAAAGVVVAGLAVLARLRRS